MKRNEVEQTEYVKLLGLWLDKDLKYLEHLRVIKNKCPKFISLFYQTKNYLSTNMLINILKLYVQPIYQYGSLPYGTA